MVSDFHALNPVHSKDERDRCSGASIEFDLYPSTEPESLDDRFNSVETQQ